MSAREAASQPFSEAVWLLVALAYAALCLAVLFCSWRLARRALASFEARSFADEPPMSTPDGKDLDGQGRGGAYREPDPRAAPPRLAMGCLPRPDQLWAVAYLRGGIDAVRELIVAWAFLEGLLADRPPAWLPGARFRPGAAGVVGRPCTDAVLSAFHRALGPAGEEQSDGWVLESAKSIATELRAELEADVVSSRLKLRDVPWVPVSIVGVSSALLVGLGSLFEFAVIPPERGPTLDFARQAMLAATCPLAIATYFALRNFLARTGTAATAYLRWLDTVRPSVDLAQGPPRAEDAALAMAVRGWKVLKGDPRLPSDFHSRFVEGPAPP